MNIKKILFPQNIAAENSHKTKIDHSITFIMIVFVIVLFSSIQFFAQEKVENKNSKKANKTLIPSSTQAVNDKIEFKNDSGNSIMTVTDEGGNSGSINLPDVNSQLSGDKLYNNGGELYFGKNPVNSNSPDEDWEISGNDIYSKNSGNVGIGVTNPSSKLHVNGDVQTLGFNMETGASDGYVLTSNSTGYGTWQAPPSVGLVPIGSIIPWAKSLMGVPSLQNDFVECNGQILNDPNSPLNNQVLPNLNGFPSGPGNPPRFLRGGHTSGNEGGSETHTHNGVTQPTLSDANLVYEGQYSPKSAASTGHVHSFTTTSTSTLPSYYEVVFIIRVK